MNIVQPLVAAIESGSPRIVAHLVAKGANVNVLNSELLTPVDTLKMFFDFMGKISNVDFC